MLMTSCFVCATLNLGRKKSTGTEPYYSRLPTQFRTFAQFRIIQIEEYLILLNDSAGEFKLLSEKVHSLTDIFI